MNPAVRDWLVDNWLALFALVISVGSLSVTVEQCADARLHDQPRMTYEYDFDKTGAGWHVDNTGLGPARLRGFRIIVDGKSMANFEELRESLGLGRAESINVSMTMPRVGYSYPVGYSHPLFWLTSPQSEIDHLSTVWTKVVIEACYCSIHDQCWRFNSLKVSPNGDPRDDSCSTFQGMSFSLWWDG
jgi:hypothetical protein